MPATEDAVTHRVGAWRFDLTADGSVGHLVSDAAEVLRGLQFVVRDDAWGTVRGDRTMDVRLSGAALEARLETVHAFPGGLLRGEARLSVRGTTLQYEMTARAEGRVRTNRVGFVLLHPLALAGAPVELIHPMGGSSRSTFPRTVSPHQPFQDLSGIVHDLRPEGPDPGPRVTFTLTGDVFETEDQRNWSDASFKTYSRPLALPFPYDLADGETVHQSVTVELLPAGLAPAARATGRGASADRTARPSSRRPRLAVSLGDPAALGALSAAEALARIGADAVRVDVIADSTLRGRESLRAAAGAPVDLVVHVGSEPTAALSDLARDLAGIGCDVQSVTVFSLTEPTSIREDVIAVRAALGELPVIVGTDDHLAELTRNPLGHSEGGTVTFSLTPQVHDDADRAVMETVEALPAMVETARLAGGGREVAVGMLSLRPRRNIHRPGVIPDRLGVDENATDARQHEPFTAAWFVATFAALAEAGVGAVTAFELAGARGVLGRADAAGSPATTPLTEVVRALAVAERVTPVPVDGIRGAVALRLHHGTRRSILVANTTAETLDLDLAAAGRRGIRLPPYATRVLDDTPASRPGGPT